MTLLKSIFIILITTLLFHCSENIQDTVPGSQTITDKSVVSITPVDATARTSISLRTNDSLINNGEITWYVNGYQEETSNSFRFTSDELKKDDIVQAVIVKDNKEYYSNEIVIKNTPPSITKSQLVPSKPVVSSILRIDIDANDVDNDNISFTYKWSINGKFISEQSYLETELKRGDKITVEVTPFDGEDSGKSVKLKSKVVNSLPLISENSPAINGKIYTYHLMASDPDGDILTYILKQGPDGMTIDPANGIITWKVQTDNELEHEVKVLVSDNHGGEVLVSFTTRISFERGKG